GWLWAGSSDRSIGVAVRDFWEEGPKALRLGADGSLAVECYAHWQPKDGESRPVRERTPDYSKHPRLDDWAAAIKKDPEQGMKLWLEDTQYPGPVRRGPFRFGKGRAKTTDVLYLFGETNNKKNEIDVLAAQRHRLIPVVDPKYVASTRALPFVTLAASESGLPVFEKGLLDLFENWRNYATRYGFLHFGDDQCSWGYNRTVPSTTDDQEYDTTQCLTMQFARTGNPDYLRWADICARHFTDVDQVHPTGELHYHGYTSGGDYHEENVGCDMGGHPYIGGIINHYMLTGDRRSLRSIQRLAEALKNYGQNARESVLTTDGRSLSRPGICLAAIYDLTRDPVHLEPVKRMVDAINDLTGDVTNELKGQPPFRMWWFNHSEMTYHIRELLVRYHAATGDENTFATLMQAVDIYLHDLWDSEHEAWRGWLGAPHDYNMPYENPVARQGRSSYTTNGYAAAEKGWSFAYMAALTGDNNYLVPFLDYLDNLGSDYAKNFGNRRFARQQLWSLPFVSMLPSNWRENQDKIVQREVLRASLKESDGLSAWTPEGEIRGRTHGDALWTDGPFGRVLRTYDTIYVTFPAPKDILELPGTVSFWVRKDEDKWDRNPWPWYGALRGLLYIGSNARETNALDLMMLKDNLWTRLYDHRCWEMAAIKSSSPKWEAGEWHHIAVVWNRYSLTTYINGEQVGSEDRFALPNGGQTDIYLGWRPTNRYGQADYFDLRIFRSALPPQRIKKIYESSKIE
ncbi:MAG: LamG-like jellyroll fold domain-containing protein, partial [bacterium]